jgi:threonine/homoserine/homoserine lactone efflux protein
MDTVHIFGFVVVASLLVMSPGPNSILIAKTVPVSGKAAGFANVAGFVSAFYLHGSLSILGVSLLLVQSSYAFTIFKLVGALYLCWIGLKAILSAWGNSERLNRPKELKRPLPLKFAFLEGFLTNALNPKVSMFYLAAFPQFVPMGSELSQAYVLVFIHSVINCLWFGAMVLLLSRIQKFAQGRTFRRWLRMATGTIFLGFGIKLALLRPVNNGY